MLRKSDATIDIPSRAGETFLGTKKMWESSSMVKPMKELYPLKHKQEPSETRLELLARQGDEVSIKLLDLDFVVRQTQVDLEKLCDRSKNNNNYLKDLIQLVHVSQNAHEASEERLDKLSDRLMAQFDNPEAPALEALALKLEALEVQIREHASQEELARAEEVAALQRLEQTTAAAPEVPPLESLEACVRDAMGEHQRKVETAVSEVGAAHTALGQEVASIHTQVKDALSALHQTLEQGTVATLKTLHQEMGSCTATLTGVAKRLSEGPGPSDLLEQASKDREQLLNHHATVSAELAKITEMCKVLTAVDHHGPAEQTERSQRELQQSLEEVQTSLTATVGTLCENLVAARDATAETITAQTERTVETLSAQFTAALAAQKQQHDAEIALVQATEQLAHEKALRALEAAAREAEMEKLREALRAQTAATTLLEERVGSVARLEEQHATALSGVRELETRKAVLQEQVMALGQTFTTRRAELHELASTYSHLQEKINTTVLEKYKNIYTSTAMMSLSRKTEALLPACEPRVTESSSPLRESRSYANILAHSSPLKKTRVVSSPHFNGPAPVLAYPSALPESDKEN